MIIFYNPHVDDFLGEPLHFRVLGRRALKKYAFFINEMIKQRGAINVLIDGEISAILPNSFFSRLPEFIRSFISALEFRMWCRLNEIPLSKVVFALSKNWFEDSLVLAFSYKAACGNFERRAKILKRYRAVIFHLSHYFVATREKAENLKYLPNLILAGDSDITKNKYFKEFFGYYDGPFLVLPFSVSPRFVRRTGLTERSEKCLATGTFHDLTLERPEWKYHDFMCSSGLSTYHPLRKAIFESQVLLKNKIYCKISPYRNYESSNFFYRMVAHFNISQRKYFEQDIVSLYNKFRYAVVGEEWSGFPALGAFEAMACGALMIGDPRYYVGLGLSPGVHFIPHDGTLNGLLKSIAEIDQNVAFEIAERGYRSITDNFNSKSMFSTWCNTLSEV